MLSESSFLNLPTSFIIIGFKTGIETIFNGTADGYSSHQWDNRSYREGQRDRHRNGASLDGQLLLLVFPTLKFLIWRDATVPSIFFTYFQKTGNCPLKLIVSWRRDYFSIDTFPTWNMKSLENTTDLTYYQVLCPYDFGWLPFPTKRAAWSQGPLKYDWSVGWN